MKRGGSYEKQKLTVVFALGISIAAPIAAVEPAPEANQIRSAGTGKTRLRHTVVRYKGWPEEKWNEYSTLST